MVGAGRVGHASSAGSGSRRSGSSTSRARASHRQDRANPPRRLGRAESRATDPARRSGPPRRGPSPATDPPTRGQLRRGHRPRHRPARAHDRRVGHCPRRRQGADDAVDVLVGHRCRHQRDRTVRQVRAEVVERGRQGRRPGRVVGPVQEDVASRSTVMSSRRPGQTALAYPAPARRRRRCRDPGRLEGVEESRRRSRRWRPGGDHGDSTRVRPEAGQLDLDPIPIPAEQRRRLDLGERHAHAPRAPCG